MKEVKFPYNIGFIALIFIFISCSTNDEMNLCDGSLVLIIEDVFDAVENQAVGKIKVEASGGVEPYIYSIDGVSFSENNEFSNLGSGSYIVSVKDANDCMAEEEVFVSQQMVVSYAKEIVPILETNCMISGCHCDGNSLCFDNYQTVKDYSRGIRDRTSARAMPPSYSGKTLTDNEIANIANWFYQGILNN